MKIGLVGLPNVGKSTLFKALTKAQVDIANYPFCTIEPNIGIVPVPDNRLNKLAEIVNPEKIVPAVIEFVDIAGLVAGASKGEGLGNKFLSHIREVDAIANVLRYFQDGDIVHVAGKIDPIDDLNTIILELILSDLQTVDKSVSRFEKSAKSGSKDDKTNLETILKIKNWLEQEKAINQGYWSQEEWEIIKPLCLLTAKPMINIINVSETQASDQNIANQLNLPGVNIILSAKIESELIDLSPTDASEYLTSLGLRESGLNRLAQAGYERLNLISYFTAGPMEVKAWTIEKNTLAPEAAGKIHTDFIKNFIKAEITNWQYFVENKGWEGCRDKGLLRIEGKEYIVQDGDVIYFKLKT